MSEPWISEFLYRGRGPGSEDGPSWHITLSRDVDDGFGGQQRLARTLNMAQARSAGWDLPAIIAAVNADALRELETVKAERDEARAMLDGADSRESLDGRR